MDTNIAVIGAGVVGLSTALAITRSLKSSSVCVFADKFEDDTLSAGAGGLFRPEINVHHDNKCVMKWCEDSFKHFLELVSSTEAAEAGIQLVSGYHLSSNKVQVENELLKKVLPEYREMNSKELSIFPPCYKYGIFYTTVVVDCRYYLRWLKSKLEDANVKIIVKHISSLHEIPENFNFIINCTGLGAKQLVKDDFLVPIRGQTIKVSAPWIKHFYYGDNIYIIPGLDYITLGGIKDYGSWNMDVNPYQKQYIWDKCTELVPSLKNAKFAWDWVGLRPYRPSVRIDATFCHMNGSLRKIINNYGHGGHGVTLSWGTALEAANLVKNISTKHNFQISKL